VLRDNGKDPEARLARFGAPPVDLLWDMSGRDNRWDQPGASAFPQELPGRSQ